MKLSIKAFAAACGLVWGGAILFVSVAHGLWPDYGQPFLDLITAVYPGLGGLAGAARAVGGVLYGLLDGSVAGALLAWLYNRFAA